jgi:hypothetical protein
VLIVWSHFPELEPKLELLLSGYNADLTEGKLEAFWTRMHRASESLSSWVPLPAAHNPPDATWGGGGGRGSSGNSLTIFVL